MRLALESGRSEDGDIDVDVGGRAARHAQRAIEFDQDAEAKAEVEAFPVQSTSASSVAPPASLVQRAPLSPNVFYRCLDDAAELGGILKEILAKKLVKAPRLISV